jgi:hypothetical protein
LTEDVYSGIEQPKIAAGWLFDELGHFVVIEVDCTVLDGLWALNDCHCHSRIGVGGANRLDDPVVDDLIAVDQQKRTVRTIAGLKKGVTAIELIVLCMVGE